jgi:RpiR family carbohydrate utilization transcriptional regulator
LAGSLSEGVPFIHRNVNADDKAEDVLVKVVDNAAAAFLKYRNDASGAAIEKAAKAMAQTQRKNKRLEFFGVGNSGFVAQDAQHKFFRLGFHTSAHSDGHLQIMSASLLKPGDCLVLISNSGRTRDLLDACEIAHKNRVTTVVITASGSPLAKAGQIHLAADHPESYEKFSPMVSRLLHLMIVDVLATTMALRIGSTQLQPMLRNMKQNLLNRRYL